MSAFVKGQGVSVLKQLEIVTRLKDSVANGSINNRQGALFVLECLSDRLGLLFEPYIIQVVPVLLKSFSHSSDHVREAAQGTAKVKQLAKMFQIDWCIISDRSVVRKLAVIRNEIDI